MPSDSWRETFNTIKAWRQQLKESDGILLRKEFHATDSVAGRGRIAPHDIPNGRRCAIFREALGLLAGPLLHQSRLTYGLHDRPETTQSFAKRLFSSAPGEIRTPDPQVRSLMLYPTELRARRQNYNISRYPLAAQILGKL